MLGLALRLLWRVMVFALLVFLTYTTFFVAFPYLDRRLPFVVAVLVVYILIAYFVLPTVIRFWRLVIKPDHIPRYVTTPDGWPADPVNIAVVARSKRHFIKAMKKAGWHTADKATLKNSLREAYALLFAKPYPTAPFSTFYLFGRPFDIGFQIPYGKNGSPRHRHHVRFWQLHDLPGQEDNKDFAYWFERVRHLFAGRQTVWIGAAIDDKDITGIRWRNLQLTHGNAAEHTKERDYIINTLSQHGLVKKVSSVKDGEPFKMRSQNIGTTFIVDGYIKVVELRNPLRVRLAEAVTAEDSHRSEEA